MASIEPGRAEDDPSTRAAEVAALFDTESERYDEAHEGPRAHLLHTRMAVVLAAVGPGPGKALDAGMGPGRLCAALEENGWTAFGVDISGRMVELAARRLPGARDRLLQGSIMELPFPDETFDAVAATGVLEYLPDPAAGVAELVRVLVPGGLVVASIPNSTSLKERWTARVLYPPVRAAKRVRRGFGRPAPHRKPVAMLPRTLEEMLQAAGAAPTSRRFAGVEVVPPPLDRAAPGLARWLSQRLESSRPRVARALTSQVIVVARKPAAPPGPKLPRASTS